MYNFQTAASCQPQQDIAAILSLPTDDYGTTDSQAIHEKSNTMLCDVVQSSQSGYYNVHNALVEDISYASSGSSPTLGLGTDGSKDQFSAFPPPAAAATAESSSHQYQTFCNTRQFPLGESSLTTAAGDINNTAIASRTEPPLPPDTLATSLPTYWDSGAINTMDNTNTVHTGSPSQSQAMDLSASPALNTSTCQDRESKLDVREDVSAKCRHLAASCLSSVHASADEVVSAGARSDSCWSAAAPSEAITPATVNRTNAVSSSGIDPDCARLGQGTAAALTLDFFQPLKTDTNINSKAGMLAQTTNNNNDDGSHSSFSSNSSVRTSTADRNMITQAESQAAAAMLSFPAAAQTMRYDPGLNFDFYRRNSQASIPDAAGMVDYYSSAPMQVTNTAGVSSTDIHQQQISATATSTATPATEPVAADLLPADAFNVNTYSYMAKPATYQHRASLPNLYFSQQFPGNFCDSSSAIQTQAHHHRHHHHQQQSATPNSSGTSLEAMYKSMNTGNNGIFEIENGLLEPFNYNNGLGSKKKREQSPLAGDQRKRRHLGLDYGQTEAAVTGDSGGGGQDSFELQFTKQRSRSLDFGTSVADASWLNMTQEDDYPDISRSDLEAAKHDPSAIPRRQKPRYDGDDYTPKWVRYTGQLKEGYCDSCKPGKWLQLKNSAYWYHKQFFHGISSVSGKRFMEPLERRAGEQDTVEGLCHQCRQFVPICNAKRKTSVLWYRHAHKCHIYDKPKSRVTGDNGSKRSNGNNKLY